MARSVDQVEHVFSPLRARYSPDRMALDGDALFALQVHAVQDLGPRHFPLVERIGLFQQAVGQCRFAVDVAMMQNCVVFIVE